MAMNGFSQVELDALCNHGAVVTDEPSSPLGCLLLARKRSRKCRSQPDAEHVKAVEALAQASNGDGLDASAGGLSQAALTELSVELQPSEDLGESSPTGVALRRVKNRRCWGAEFNTEGPAEVAQAVDNGVQAPGRLAAAALQCPASWGGGGLSQAELDAMCAVETGSAPEAQPVVTSDTTISEVKQDALPAPVLSAPNSPQRRRRTKAAGENSSPRKNRAQWEDVENMGSRSPGKILDKSMEFSSPGLSPGLAESKPVSMSPFSSPQSPQRRPRLASSPLSPALLN